MPLGAGKARPTFVPELKPLPSPKAHPTSISVAWTRTVSGPAEAVASGIDRLPASQNQDGSPVRPRAGFMLTCRSGQGCEALACCASANGDGAGAPAGALAGLPTHTVP